MVTADGWRLTVCAYAELGQYLSAVSLSRFTVSHRFVSHRCISSAQTGQGCAFFDRSAAAAESAATTRCRRQ